MCSSKAEPECSARSWMPGRSTSTTSSLHRNSSVVRWHSVPSEVRVWPASPMLFASLVSRAPHPGTTCSFTDSTPHHWTRAVLTNPLGSHGLVLGGTDIPVCADCTHRQECLCHQDECNSSNLRI